MIATKKGKEIYRVSVQEALGWHNGKQSLREALHDVAFHNSDLPRREQECEDTGGDFWSDCHLVVCVQEMDLVVYLIDNDTDSQTVTLRLASDNRPACPDCGKGLYAALEEHVSRTIPEWQGEEGPYNGFYASSFDGDTSSDLVRLYCDCGWAIDPREVEVVIEQ